MQSGAAQLRDWMDRRTYNMTETAAVLGLQLPHLSMILSGKRFPGRNKAVKIERLTGIPVEAWSLSESHTALEPVATISDNGQFHK
jgi:transcriptional regulator with XRE-family HTH domain